MTCWGSISNSQGPSSGAHPAWYNGYLGIISCHLSKIRVSPRFSVMQFCIVNKTFMKTKNNHMRKTLLLFAGIIVATLTTFAQEKESKTLEQKNKEIVLKWLNNFWSSKYNPAIIDELAAPDMILQYSLHKPRKGKADIKDFMKKFRDAFPDLAFEGAYPLLADGEYVIARWVGGGTIVVNLR